MKKLVKNNSFWKYFYDLCLIPRESSKESLVRDYLINFAEENSLYYYSDNIGNLVIVKQFYRYENLVLQAHMDMVFVKEFKEVQNFVIPERNGNFINAQNTSLGADNGIGIAYILALLADSKLDSKYNLICIFTVEEETTMNGAKLFSQQLFSEKMSKLGLVDPFKKLVSFDGFSQDSLIVGTAGAKAWKVETPLKFKRRKEVKLTVVKITLDNFLGGHSGNDIILNQDNPIKICVNMLFEIINEFSGVQLHTILVNQDAKINAIARECEVTISFSTNKEAILQRIQTLMIQEFNKVQSGTYQIELLGNIVKKSLNNLDSKRVVSLLYKMLHGVIYKNNETVLLSVNLAKVEVLNDRFSMGISARGFKKYLNEIDRDFAKNNQFVFVKTLDIPSSDPGTNNKELIEELEIAYEGIFHSLPNRSFANFCTELGYFATLFPLSESVILSPNIFNAHSPSESLQVDSADKIFKVVERFLQK